MIPRYSRAEMARIWEPENRLRIWFEIEAYACDAQAELGVIPASAAKNVWKKGKWELARIDEIEKETRHDVLAFLTNLAEHIGPDARFVHQGMTSSDILDTAL
ncbi:MAG: adenylosuccinate lyase, partial [Alphaproteobacteria bacterium]|nr:adenylosuccinate lyase [Alphaproteobacteria bacterium]